MNSAQKAGLLMFAGAAQFVLAVIMGEGLHPGYIINTGYLSDLGAGPYSGIFNISVFLVGLAFFAVAYYIRKAFPERKALPLLLVLGGIGPVVVGVFSENFTLYARSINDAGLAGTSSVLHDLGALIAYLFGGLAAIESRKIVRKPVGYLAVLLGAITLVALALNVAGVAAPIGAGGLQRMVVYPELLWALGVGGYLMGKEDIGSAPGSP